MKKLIIASQNKDKVNEIKKILPKYIQLISLKDINYYKELAENGLKIEENAVEKTNFVHKLTLEDCFSDDSALEIDALNGEPGVYSSRYAKISPIYKSNIEKVLIKLKNKKNRQARFRTIIALNFQRDILTFEGVLKGKIGHEPKGDKGFGYDSIFIPIGYDISLAQMNTEQKINISHRTIAIKKMICYLNKKINDKNLVYN